MEHQQEPTGDGSQNAPQEMQNQRQEESYATPRQPTSHATTRPRQPSMTWPHWLIDGACATTPENSNTTHPTTNTTTTQATSTKCYPSVLWNGQLGNLLLTSSHLVLEIAADCGGRAANSRTTIPWHDVAAHHEPTTATKESALHPSRDTRLSANQEAVDLRISLKNGDTIDVLFSEQQDIQLVQDELDLRILHSHSSNDGGTNTTHKTDQDMQDFVDEINRASDTLLGSHTLISSTQSSTGSVDDEEEQAPLMMKHKKHGSSRPSLELENAALRQSVGSLLSKVEEMEQREAVHSTSMAQLQSQFDTFQRSLLMESTKAGEQGTTVRFLLDNGDPQGTVEYGKDGILTDPTGDNNNAMAIRQHTHTRRSVFTSATDKGMDAIRRKLSFRTSTVTGQKAFAKTLPSDSYAFLMVAPLWGIPWFMGLIVWAIQITLYVLMILSTLDETGATFHNSLGVPPNVDTSVRIVQLLALIIAVITQDDLMKALDMIRFRKSKSFLEAFPNSSVPKVAFGISTRVFEGLMGLMASFFLVVTSDSIYYLLLNFTALEFISQLDEAFFVLSHYGFAGRYCEIAAKAVEETTYYVHTKVYRKRKIALFAIICVLMVGSWIGIATQQRSGAYLCQTLFVQFGDDMDPSLAAFSGLYDQITVGSVGKFLSNTRVRYVDRNSGTGIFAYCPSRRFWSFSHTSATEVAWSEDYDPCEDWQVRSSFTGGYDINSVASEDWIVRNEVSRQAIMDPFLMMCSDCDDAYSACNGRGTCSDAVCECDDAGYYGLQCEFEAPCHVLKMDSRFDGFQGTRPWSDEYDLLKVGNDTVSVYHRPVYISKSVAGSEAHDLIFFTGRRWAVSYTTYILASDTTTEELVAYFEDQFHAHWANYTIAFISEPVDKFTPGDSQSPEGLQWYIASDKYQGQTSLQRPDTNRPVEGSLLCSVCDSRTNPCLYDGVCVEGTCSCLQQSGGSLCEQPPIGNGWCDGSLNTAQYDLDGGDCCASTCISDADPGGFTCGREASGYGYIGYDCKLPLANWELHKAPGLTGGDGARLGYSIALSRHGNFLAVGIPGQDMVVVFDRDGGKWKQRGWPLIGDEDTGFGETVRVSSGPDNLLNNPEFEAPFVVAVGAASDGNGTSVGSVSLYRCNVTPEAGDCSTTPQKFYGYSAFDISDDGGTLALGETFNVTAMLLAGNTSLTAPQVHLVSIETETPYLRRIIEPRFPMFTTENTDDDASPEIQMLLHYISSISISSGAGRIAIQTAAVDLGSLTLCVFQPQSCETGSIGVLNSIIGEDDKMLSLMEGYTDYYGPARDLVVSTDGQVVAFAPFSCNETLSVLFVSTEGELIPHPQLPSWPVDECSSDINPPNMTLALSGNGNTVAIGYKDSAYVYDFNGTAWNFVGDEALNQYATRGSSSSMTAVSLSGDGSTVALGMSSIGTGGQAAVLSTPRRQSICNPGEETLILSYTTDDEPSTLSWTVFNNDSLIQEAQPGRYQYKTATYVHEICVPRASCSIVTFYDQLVRDNEDTWFDYDPQLKLPGRIDLDLDHEKKSINGFTGAMRRVFMGNDCLTCPSGQKLFRAMVRTCEAVAWELVDNVGTKLFQGSADYLGLDSIKEQLEDWYKENGLDVSSPFDRPALFNKTSNASTSLIDTNRTIPLAELPQEPLPCETDVHWEEVCLDTSSCYTFYAFKANPLQIEQEESLFSMFGEGSLTTEFHLFYDDDEFFKYSMLEEGQKSVPVGSCTRPMPVPNP